MQEEYVIETRNIFKQYKNMFAVNDVSVHVKRGDIYGLIGKNGAGKTTLMKLILGLAKPTQGEVILFGGNNLDAARTKIGSLIEDPGLYRGCTAYENMLRFSILYDADKNQIDYLLKLVGLADTGKKKAGTFSLGMKQRLGIAIALLAHPEVLVLDEPTNGLDPAGIKEIRDLILRLNKEHGVTFIISSHLLDELAKVVTCYGIINNGYLTQEISAKDLEAQCRHFATVKTQDPAAAAKLLREEFEDIELVEGEGCVTLYTHIDRTSEIAASLIKGGLNLSELTITSYGLEEFFIERLGR